MIARLYFCRDKSFTLSTFTRVFEKTDHLLYNLDDQKAQEISNYLDIYGQAISTHLLALKEGDILRGISIYPTIKIDTILDGLLIKRNILCLEARIFSQNTDFYSYYFYKDKLSLFDVPPILCV